MDTLQELFDHSNEIEIQKEILKVKTNIFSFVLGVNGTRLSGSELIRVSIVDTNKILKEVFKIN
jgi:hypothetical protein